MEDDHPIFERPYKLSLYERIGVQAHCDELDTSLVELSIGDYVCATVMLSKKDIFGNWTKKEMCVDYRLVNKNKNKTITGCQPKTNYLMR